ncbi:MAG: AMP-binding protein, partial [Acidobacteria bacterium]|nr:AMP-binding protein [Acidobacteriota bacterium]
MNGLIMEYPLTVTGILRRADVLFGHKQIVSRGSDSSIRRYRYADMVKRAKRLALALRELGVQPGDRVATLGWNHSYHLEAYFAIPAIRGVLHTLNLRLHHDELAYIINDAQDSVLLLDESLLALYEQVQPAVAFRHVILMSESGQCRGGMIDYEELLESAEPEEFQYEEPDERSAAAMCYTSGTTGRPKGVVYSHRALALHSMACGMVDTLAVGEADTVLPVVPMFHINAWGLPFTSALVGANQVLPGRHIDPVSLLGLLESEQVTVTAGVPTVWLGVLQALDADPGRYDLRHLRTILTGGSAAPMAMVKGFEERHGLRVLHAWGMTEMTPIGTVATVPSYLRDSASEPRDLYRTKQGTPLPFIEIRARGDAGLVPWDGKTSGELEVRGPWVASAYYGYPHPDDRFTTDGWFRTGDVVSIDEHGCIEIRDRAKDLVKSGGEWISSVALENALMGH